jgi:hypothetical protein
MKKTILTLSMVFLFASTLVFTGCSKKDDTATPATTPTPTITLNSGAGFTAASGPVGTSTSVKFGVLATPVTSSTLTHFKVTVSYDGQAAQTLLDSVISTSSLTWQRYYTTSKDAGQELYSFIVTDKNGQTSTAAVTLTKAAIPSTVSQTGTLGAKNNVAGSFFDVTNGVVYTETVATGKSNLVDFAYFSPSTTSTGIGAVSDQAVSGAAPTGSYPNTSSWATKNATKLTKSTTYTTANFASVTDAQIAGLTAPTTTVVNNIMTGDVLEFQTVNNKKGLIKIESITPGLSGTVNISVKVQK